MKNFAVIILLVSIALTSFIPPQTSFEGTWGTSTRTSSFDLYLRQKNDTITGSHISIQQKGKRLDSGNGDEITINGTVDSTGITTITFKSGYATKTGIATLKRISNKMIEWTIIAKPQDEAYYIPDHAILSWKKK